MAAGQQPRRMCSPACLTRYVASPVEMGQQSKRTWVYDLSTICVHAHEPRAAHCARKARRRAPRCPSETRRSLDERQARRATSYSSPASIVPQTSPNSSQIVSGITWASLSSPLPTFLVGVAARMRACVAARVRACVAARVRACVAARVRALLFALARASPLAAACSSLCTTSAEIVASLRPPRTATHGPARAQISQTSWSGAVACMRRSLWSG